jgi:hypothetical protein
MYVLDAKAAIFRSERRLLPALAAILIPAGVLSIKGVITGLLRKPCSIVWADRHFSMRLRR